MQAWVAGFLTGYNIASATDPDFLGKSMPDKVAMYIWIDNYCRDKPLNIVAAAVMALKDELVARALWFHDPARPYPDLPTRSCAQLPLTRSTEFRVQCLLRHPP